MPNRHPPTVAPSLLGRLTRHARQAVEEVGEAVAFRHRPRPREDVERKGEGDFVTPIDRRGERRLRELLLEAFPDHGFLGEEGEPERPDAEFVWIADPIDGTSNFVQGLPTFGVAVACLHRGHPVAAAVRSYPEDVTYSAAVGRGARRGSRRLDAPAARLDDAAVIGVQWFRGEFDPTWMAPVLECGARVRVLGSTVVQLCDTAAGRLHANLQPQGRIWDLAAAALVAAEAGCRVTDWDGRPLFPFADLTAPRHYPTLVAPHPIHGALLERLRRR